MKVSGAVQVTQGAVRFVVAHQIVEANDLLKRPLDRIGGMFG